MGPIKFLVSLICVYLLALFVVQLLRVAWSVLRGAVDDFLAPHPILEHPDDADTEPISGLGEIRSYLEIGRDRFGRMIYRSWGEGRYYYVDHSAARRVRPKPPKAAAARQARPRPGADRGEAHLRLGWKGFDANSSPWEVLGVARDASIGQIKAAYRKLITKFHPDRFQNLSEAEIAELERDTKLIHAAYSRLVKP